MPRVRPVTVRFVPQHHHSSVNRSSTRTRISSERLHREFLRRSTQRKSVRQKIRNFCRSFVSMCKTIFKDVFSRKCAILALYSLTQLTKLHRSIPLAKKVTWRHLAIEPLCCISSMHIRSGCLVAACCQLMAIIAVTCSACVKLWAAFEFAESEALTSPRTFNEITNHPVGYFMFGIFNIIWLISVIMLMIGVSHFNPHLMRPNIAIQVISVLVYSVVGVFMSIQLGVGVTDNAHNGPVEEITTLASCVFVVFVIWWSISIVHECAMYFQLCQVLLDLATIRQKPRAKRVSTVSEGIEFNQN